jgi:DNA-binding response OmpR family regulator
VNEPAVKSEHGRTILVVEDNAQVCELINDILEAAGFPADCVQSDRTAYERLRRGARYACMLVDVNLGSGTTGYDVARFAREIDPGLPVIYVSGQTSPQSMQVNGVPGALFVEKPFTPNELIDAVRILVGHNDD